MRTGVDGDDVYTYKERTSSGGGYLGFNGLV